MLQVPLKVKIDLSDIVEACKALKDSRRLIQHHGILVEQHVTILAAAILPAVDALRSQTAHAALVTLQALPWHLETDARAQFLRLSRAICLACMGVRCKPSVPGWAMSSISHELAGTGTNKQAWHGG